MRSKLSDFRVDGFRALDHLDLQDLGQVNLLVGKNNTGKTTVLEALRVFLSPDPQAAIYSVLTGREEFSFSSRRRPTRINTVSGPQDGPPLAFEAIFTGRPNLQSNPRFSMNGRGIADNNNLNVEFVWLRQDFVEEDSSYRYNVIDYSDEVADAVPGFQIHSDKRRTVLPVDRMTRFAMRRRLSAAASNNIVYLPSSGLSVAAIGEVWDGIALTDDEDMVVEALRIIAPELEKIVLVQTPGSSSARMLMAKLRNFSEPVPFKSLGEGTVHILSIVLAMMQAQGGYLLIDEIENGVHYSVQEQMWRLVLEQSARTGVQVFTTSHSWDCVLGFERAAQSVNNVPARLFRLERGSSGIKSVSFSSDEVAIAAEEAIEIR